jgi:hypothetical protein
VNSKSGCHVEHTTVYDAQGQKHWILMN